MGSCATPSPEKPLEDYVSPGGENELVALGRVLAERYNLSLRQVVGAPRATMIALGREKGAELDVPLHHFSSIDPDPALHAVRGALARYERTFPIRRIVRPVSGKSPQGVSMSPSRTFASVGDLLVARGAKWSLLVLLALPCAPSQAQSRCSTDSLGTTTCRHMDGSTTRATTDSLGNTTLRHSSGRTTRVHTDSLGVTTYRHSDGTTTRATTDSLGNTTYRGSDGTSMRCRKDALGNLTCR